MKEYVMSPAGLPAGFYWFFERGGNEVWGKDPVVVEKRSGEDFVRFTNGRIERYGANVLKFVGPLVPPAAESAVGSLP